MPITSQRRQWGDVLNACRRPNNLDRNPRYSAEDRGRANHGVVVRDCADCTLTGLHVNGVRHASVGVRIENCRRLNVTSCTILDCDHVGLLLNDVSDSRVSGCLIRDDRPGGDGPVSLRLTGGRGNMVVGNLLGGRHEIDPAAAHAEGSYGV